MGHYVQLKLPSTCPSGETMEGSLFQVSSGAWGWGLGGAEEETAPSARIQSLDVGWERQEPRVTGEGQWVGAVQ